MVFQSAKLREKAKKNKTNSHKKLQLLTINFQLPISNHIETQAYQQQQVGFSFHGNRN